MIPSICQKIQSLVNNGITQECHVVYLLTCIRKVLEQEENNEQFRVLKFYCDWVLHAKLSGTTAQDILSYFNEGHLILRSNERTLPNSIQDISKFEKLITGIKAFLEDHNINFPEYSVSDESKFISLYASIVEDCPLVINPHISPSSNIQKVTVRVEFAKDIQHGQKLYKVSWIITDSTDQAGELFVINSFDA